MYCSGHKKEHADTNWKHIEGGWYCTDYHKPSRMSEFVPERLKDDRHEYFNSIVQPYRGDDLSKEYIEAHGTKGIGKEVDISKAKEVWTDLPGWHDRKHTK